MINWLRRRWVFYYGELLTLLIRHPRTLGRIGALRSSLFMRRQLPDPALRAKVWPDYTFGCKRVLFSSHYLPALGRPNVELVTDPIAEITPGGIRTADGREHPLDCIIWSTGFRPRSSCSRWTSAARAGCGCLTRGPTAPTPTSGSRSRAFRPCS